MLAASVNLSQVWLTARGIHTIARGASCSVTPDSGHAVVRAEHGHVCLLVLSVSQFWEEWVLIPNLEWEQSLSTSCLLVLIEQRDIASHREVSGKTVIKATVDVVKAGLILAVF